MKKIVFVMMLIAVLLSGCASAANVASQNLSTAADNFQIDRRIVFYNGITGEYILVVEGKCSLGNYDANRELSVTCKTGDSTFKKHFLGLSDNVTYFAEQIEGASVGTYNYRVIFRPETILPAFELGTSGK
jgi:ABC-type Fe3+-hydroxamate transport system substrate-binding protein